MRTWKIVLTVTDSGYGMKRHDDGIESDVECERDQEEMDEVAADAKDLIDGWTGLKAKIESVEEVRG